MKDFDATLKRCADGVHFAVLLWFLSSLMTDQPGPYDILRDSMLTLSPQLPHSPLKITQTLSLLFR